MYKRKTVGRTLLSILIIVSPLIVSTYLLAQVDPIRIIAIDEASGVVFLNIGTGDGLKERQTIHLNLPSEKTIALNVIESFSNSSKLLLKDKSDVQYLKEEDIVTIKNNIPLDKSDISGESRSFVTHYSRGGVSANKSFYPQGLNARQEIDVRLKDLSLKNVDIEGFISGRATDDKYIDPEQLSFEGLHLNIQDKGGNYVLNLGDFYAYFSNYSLSQSLKGAKGFYKIQNGLGGFSITSLVGTNKHRWNDFWHEIEGESYTRYVSGVRLEQVCNTNNAKIGLNFVDTRDRRKSSASSGNPATNDIISSDLQFNTFGERIFVKLEAAEAFTDTNTSPGASVKSKSDHAYKIDTTTDLTKYGSLRSMLYSGYERAGQNFSSLSGILKTDREEYYAKLNCDTYEYLSCRLGIVQSRDNLKDGLVRSTRYRSQQFGISLRPISEKRDFEIAMDLDRRTRASSDTLIKEQSDNIHLVLRDRFGALNLWGGWQVSKHDDETTVTNGRFSHIFDLGSRLNLNCGRFNILPYLYLQFEKRKQDTTSQENIFKNVNSGVSLYSGTALTTNLNYLISDTNDNILSQNVKRQMLVLETLYFLDRDRTRDIVFSYTLDTLENKNAGRDYSESLVKLEFRQRF